MRFVFPSLANSSLRYAIYENASDNPSYSWTSSSSVISDHLSTFDTMGDGETQHSPDICPINRFETMLDFVRSLSHHVSKTPKEILDATHRIFNPHDLPSKEVLDFVRYKAIYDPDKYGVYVNVAECKKSTAESRQHDKRWLKIGSHWDGKIASVRNVLYEAEINRFVLPLQSVTLDIHIARNFGEYAWSVASRYHSIGRGSIYSGFSDEVICDFVNGVEAIGLYLKTRCECDRLERIVDRLAQKTIEVAA